MGGGDSSGFYHEPEGKYVPLLKSVRFVTGAAAVAVPTWLVGKAAVDWAHNDDVNSRIATDQKELVRLDAEEKLGVKGEARWADSIQVVDGKQVKTQTTKFVTLQQLKNEQQNDIEHANNIKQEIDLGIMAGAFTALFILKLAKAASYRWRAVRTLPDAFVDNGADFLNKKEQQVRKFFGKKSQPE